MSDCERFEAMISALLDGELKKLKTDRIDFYLMHGINREKWEYFKSIGAPEFFDDMKKAGKIRCKCFSFHGPYEGFTYILRNLRQTREKNQGAERSLHSAGEDILCCIVLSFQYQSPFLYQLLQQPIGL